MTKAFLYAAALTMALAACERSDNPLMSAEEDQFGRVIEPRTALAPSCAAALYEPDVFIQQYNALKFSPDTRINSVSEQQQADCVTELQKRASEVGIDGNVTAEHVRDDRVRQRYLAARKK